MLYNEIQIEVIKLAVSNIEATQLSSKKVLIDSIVWLRESYEKFGDMKYLEKAIWHIYAYLELGYPYDEGDVEFQKILNISHLDKAEVFPNVKWGGMRIPLKKGNIRKILGRWNGALRSMKIDDVIEDIIKNVSEKKEGEYLYHCGKKMCDDIYGGLWKHTFKLYISSQESILHNINENQYYMLERVNVNDKNSSC